MEKRLTMEELVERWNQFAQDKYKVCSDRGKMELFNEYNEKCENGLSLEMPSYMAINGRPHTIG